jgi:drug/metabolite transporter (DMT)-like permease
MIDSKILTYSFIAILSFSIHNALNKKFDAASSVLACAFIVELIACVFIGIYLISSLRSSILIEINTNDIIVGIFSGFFVSLGIVFLIKSFQFGAPFRIVSVLHAAQIFISFLVSYAHFGEHVTLQNYIGAAFVVAGLILISI